MSRSRSSAPAEVTYTPKENEEFRTAPVDYRFSTSVDKSKQCWSLYNEYLRCSKKQGVENPKCQQFLTYAKQICPFDTLNAYYEARRDNVWYGYKYPIQASELKDGDVAITPEDENYHARKWNEKHPGHEYGVEHAAAGHGKKH